MPAAQSPADQLRLQRLKTRRARADYEINWNMGLPGGLTLVGPTLRIDLDIQAVRGTL